ncbi:MAG: peptidyl-prolyl cis-trans isomerase [bacterium]
MHMKRRREAFKAFLCLCAAVSILTLSCKSTNESKPGVNSKKVVAKVNGEPVYEGDVVRRIRAVYGDVEKTKIEHTKWQMMVEAATDSEIIDRLIIQTARKEGLKVSPDGVDEVMKRSREQMGEENFRSMLHERQATEEGFRKFLEERELIAQYKKKLFSAINLDEKTLREYYEGHRDNFIEPESVLLEVITVADKEKADEVFQRWGKGEDFEKLSEAYSTKEGEHAGRKLRWMPYDAMPMDLQPKVREGKRGEILSPIQSSGKYYVIKILDKRAEKKLSYDEAKDRVREMLTAKRQQDIIEKLYEEEKEKAKIEYVN